MSRIEALELLAKTLLDNKDKVISTDEYNELVAHAKNQEEADLYTELYNYLLKKKQKELVQNGIY